MEEKDKPKPKLETIKDLYYELSRIYSCKYADREEEIEASQEHLYDAVKVKGYSVDHLIKKMKQLKARLRLAGDYESKLSAQIANRYWEKNYADEQIPYRPFKPN